MEETSLILIHSNKLNYTLLENKHKATLATVGEGAAAPGVKASWLKEETQYLVLELNAALVKDQKYKLFTKFTGELADDLGGFYRSEYKENGVTKWVPFSVFSPATIATKAEERDFKIAHPLWW